MEPGAATAAPEPATRVGEPPRGEARRVGARRARRRDARLRGPWRSGVALLDGRLHHISEPFTGERWSLVFFVHSSGWALSSERQAYLRSAGASFAPVAPAVLFSASLGVCASVAAGRFLAAGPSRALATERSYALVIGICTALLLWAGFG